jgi:putative ABC transport system permease protein
VSFFSLVVRNLVRQRTRTLLTVLGIGIGITTVIALGAVTEGLKAASEEIVHTGGADFMVAQKGAADLTFSTLTADDLATVRAQPGVERAWGALLQVTRVGSNPFFFLYGIEPADMAPVVPAPRTGRLASRAGEIAIGRRAADDLGVGVGGTIEIDRRPFTVVGVFESPRAYENGAGYAVLAEVQAVARKPRTLTMVYVIASRDPAEVAARVRAASDRLATIATAEEYGQVDQGLTALDAGNLAISLLAVVIGAIGVMNTMIMSVFERTRELGILRAVGWRGSRVVRMILGESLILCLLATVFGIALGLAASRAVTLIPAVGSFLTPSYPPEIFVRALGIAIVVALAGALYPAVRAVRLSPMEALRHE